MKLESYSFTSIGGREENQDAVGLREGKNGGVYVVADGLGGHQAGRVAADCVVSTLLAAWEADGCPDEAGLAARIGAVNDAVLAIQRERNLNTKSTVVTLCVEGDRAVWANTGDSRLYYLHDGKIAAYTNDHSVAYMKYKAGEIRREDIPYDEDQSTLLRAIGGTGRFEPDTRSAAGLCEGDAFLLCSDGFWEYVRDEEILFDCLNSDSAMAWAGKMLIRAGERIRPGNDNLSLITVLLKQETADGEAPADV